MPGKTKWWCGLVVGLVSWAAGGGSSARADLQQGAPQVTFIYPAGAGQGDKLDIAFYGSNLEEPRGVQFYDSAIKLVQFRQPEGPKPLYRRYDGRDDRWIEDRLVIAEIEVDANCRPGLHHVRLLTAGGLSVLKPFWVGRFPSVAELEDYKVPNDVPENAQAIALNHTVNGALHRFDVDQFKLALTEGQRFTAEIEGMRLGSLMAGEADLQLTLRDVAGKIVGKSLDSDLFLADPVLSVVIPQTGDYYLEVANELIETDSSPRVYRLHVGDYVRPSALFPPGGKAGELTAMQVWGDPKGVWTYTTKLAPSADGFTQVLVDHDGRALPVGHTVRVGDAANSLEVEPNNDAKQASPAVDGFPVALNGVISEAGDVDFFTFKVPAGIKHPIRVRVFAQSLGSPLDAKMSFYEIKDDGKPGQRKSSDDVQRNRLDYMWLNNHARELLDPIELYSSNEKEERTVVVEITDTHGRGGPGFFYRIEAEALPPHVYTHLPTYENNGYYQARNHIKIAQGNQYVTWLSVVPAYGTKLESDVELVARGLPQGVEMMAPTYEKGAERVPVVFKADPSVTPGAYLFDVIATSKEQEFTSSFQQPNAFSTRGGGLSQVHTFVDKLSLCVTDPAPFRIIAEQPDASLVPNGEVSFKVRLERAPGFDETVELGVDWVPSDVNRAVGVKVGPGETEADFTLAAGSKVEPGEYPIAVVARSGKGNPRDGQKLVWAGSEFVTLNVGESMVKTVMQRSSVERGKTGEVGVKVEFLRSFPGKAKVRLAGLPRGVEVVEEFIEMTEKDSQITFTVRATPNALFGMNRGLRCEFEFEQGEGTFKEKSGYGYLRIDPERGKKTVQVSK